MHVYASLYIFCGWITIKCIVFYTYSGFFNHGSLSFESIGSPFCMNRKHIWNLKNIAAQSYCRVSTSCVFNKILGSKTFRDPLCDLCVEKGEKANMARDIEHTKLSTNSKQTARAIWIIFVRPKMDRIVSNLQLYARTAYTFYWNIKLIKLSGNQRKNDGDG